MAEEKMGELLLERRLDHESGEAQAFYQSLQSLWLPSQTAFPAILRLSNWKNAMATAKDLPQLLDGIPKGEWVALSHDEERVLAHGNELQEVLQDAKNTGEPDPIVIRVSDPECVALL